MNGTVECARVPAGEVASRRAGVGHEGCVTDKGSGQQLVARMRGTGQHAADGERVAVDEQVIGLATVACEFATDIEKPPAPVSRTRAINLAALTCDMRPDSGSWSRTLSMVPRSKNRCGCS